MPGLFAGTDASAMAQQHPDKSKYKYGPDDSSAKLAGTVSRNESSE